MNLITALDVNASGLTAQRKRVEVSSSNLANSQTTRTEDGGAYRRKDVIFQTTSFQDSLSSAMGKGVEGVEISDVVDDPTPFVRRYEPGHPDADKDGYVSYPNVDPMLEMANLIEGARSYEANVAAMGIVKTMINRTLEIGR
ncbi:MAG TPA: flagellar basal body rod protein FlgC [Terriglobia bacterium]|nr:flagellar basal body rod protein FlgC [Terriglobia bacterium]